MAQKVAGAGATAKKSLTQYINLDDYVYTSGMVPFSKPLEKALGVEPLTYNGSIVQCLDTTTGFYGEAFVTTTTKTPKLIVAFQGTNPNPPSDAFGAAQVIDDTAIYAGLPAPSYVSAECFTETALADAEAADGVKPANSFITGHSLGAAEAEFVAAETGLTGVTFGAPGISTFFSEGHTTTLRNYVEQGDPVGNYAANPPRYLGSIVSSDSIRHFGPRSFVGSPSHSAILKQAALEYAKGTTKGYAESAALFGIAAAEYHPLEVYAKDLDLKLYSNDFSAGSDAGVGAASPLCFATGTLIRTARGDVAVEDLVVGDFAVTSCGDLRPIRWIGHRRVACGDRSSLFGNWPVRVCAGAFGGGVPHRDLWLSPGHPVLVGDHLVPIMCLINGTTVERVPVEAVTYWHVELDRHDILLAEGLPAESYIDLGSRPWFDGADGPLLDPDLALAGQTGRCRPVAVRGPIVDAERRRLDVLFAMQLEAACAWPSRAAAALSW